MGDAPVITVIAMAAGGLAVGAALERWLGLLPTLGLIGIAAAGYGGYLLVHRYRWGRWTP